MSAGLFLAVWGACSVCFVLGAVWGVAVASRRRDDELDETLGRR